MNTPLNSAATAEALATNFQVAELEPRLENIWVSGQESETEIAEPKK